MRTSRRQPERRQALRILLQAWEQARKLKFDEWEFAVELEVLQAAGVSTNELRWLVASGHAGHALERSRPGARRRSFSRARNLFFTEQSCFALSGKGASIAREMLGTTVTDAIGLTDSACRHVRVPRWDAALRTLFWGELVVKQFRHVAPNQELLLTSFEELRWSRRIDDPLPREFGKDSKQRLHDTIKKLNRGQTHQLVHFYGDGSGCGACWRFGC